MKINFILKRFFIYFLFSLQSFAQSINFDAKGILFLQDADFGTFSLSTNTIEREKSVSDKMGAILFPLQYGDNQNFSEKSVSNSEIHNKKAIAVMSDNRLCYVIETKGQIKKEEISNSIDKDNLPDGYYVSVVDISNLRNIKAEYRFPVGNNPLALSLSGNNEYLAVVGEAYNQELQVFELNEFGKPIRTILKPNLLGIGAITDIEWHPSGDFLAFLKKDTKEIGLIKVVKDGPTKKIVRLELLGNSIKMEGLPVVGKFSKDGKYFIVLDQITEFSKNQDQSKGKVFVIKFNYEDQGNHFLISKTEVEENPSNLVFHPNGTNILVSNMKRSFEYPINTNYTNKSSISVLGLSNDGTISNLNTINLECIMPSSIVFDKSGKNLAVGIFQYLNYGKTFGGIDFYSFFEGSKPRIIKQNSSIYTSKGTHFLKVIEDY